MDRGEKARMATLVSDSENESEILPTNAELLLGDLTGPLGSRQESTCLDAQSTLAVTTVGEGRSGLEPIPTDLGSLTGRLILDNIYGPDQGVYEQDRITTPLPPDNQNRSCATGESDQFRPIPDGAAQSDHGRSLQQR